MLGSDATLIISRGKLEGGSGLTMRSANRHDKPVLHIDLKVTADSVAVAETQKWLGHLSPKTLNIAGPRASEDREIYEKAKKFLTKVFY